MVRERYWLAKAGNEREENDINAGTQDTRTTAWEKVER